jgi:hypothetical protein
MVAQRNASCILLLCNIYIRLLSLLFVLFLLLWLFLMLLLLRLLLRLLLLLLLLLLLQMLPLGILQHLLIGSSARLKEVEGCCGAVRDALMVCRQTWSLAAPHGRHHPMRSNLLPCELHLSLLGSQSTQEPNSQGRTGVCPVELLKDGGDVAPELCRLGVGHLALQHRPPALVRLPARQVFTVEL